MVVVHSTQLPGLRNLRGQKFCHPGLFYDRTERWTERFLKHFERTVIVPQCENETVSAAEIEAEALANFFSQACRPGSWSNDPEEDKRLSKIEHASCKSIPHLANRFSTLTCYFMIRRREISTFVRLVHVDDRLVRLR